MCGKSLNIVQLEDFLFQAYTSARDNPSQPKVMDLNFSCQYQQEGYNSRYMVLFDTSWILIAKLKWII